MDSTISTLKGHSGWEPILANEVKTRKLKEGQAPVVSDTVAAAMIVQDYNRAAMYLDTHEWQGQWYENDILYQSPLLNSTDDPTRARVSRFTVNNQSNIMADAAKDALFSQKPPIFLRPRGATTQFTVDSWMALLDTLLDRMKFRYWTGLGVDCASLHGTAIWKGGWTSRTVMRLVRKDKVPQEKVSNPAGNTETIPTTESDEHETKLEPVTESFPWIEQRMLGTTLFDPGWRTPNAPELCKFAVDVDYPTWTDLKTMQDDPESPYEIPDLEELKQWLFARQKQNAPQGSQIETTLSAEGSAVFHAEMRATSTTVDPLEQPMLLLERWDEKRCMASLHIDGAQIILRNEEHGLPRIPHFTANWRNIPNNGYGMGNGKLIGGDQRLEQGVLNHSLNLLAYQFNPAILHAVGQNQPTGDRMIRAGGFFGVTPPLDGDVRKAMAVMETPKVPPEAWQMLQYSKQSSQETSGADSTFMSGQLGGKGSSAARTATGAGRIAAKSDGRVQTPVENLELGLFVPYVIFVMDMVKLHMPKKEIREILTKKYGAALMANWDHQAFFDAELEVEMLAASKLAAKAAMAQQLPQLMQIFQQPQLLEQLHNEGKTIDLAVLLDILFQVSEFKVEDEIIRDLTQKELQQLQSMHAPNTKLQESVATETVKGANALQLADRESQNRLAESVTEKALERTGGGLPFARAEGFIERNDAEKTLQGTGPSPLAGV